MLLALIHSRAHGKVFPPSGEDAKRNQRAKHTFKWVVNQLNTDDLKMLVNAKKEEEEEEKRTEEERRKKAEEERREMVKAIRTEAALFLAEMVSWRDGQNW